MVQRIADIVMAHNDDGIGQPYMIALCGIPGSGTTISAFLMATLLENLGLQTMICPLDGYHYPLDYLRTFPDPEDMIYRRGSPDTFDPAALLRDLERIKHGGGEDSLIKLPGFDHAKADPEPEKHVFDRSQHRVVICFGLYLLLDEGGWENLRSVFDLRIFLNSDVDDCIERVKVRNQCIPGYSPEEIAERAERVDRVNAIIVLNTRDKADIVVQANAPEPSRPTSPTQLEKALTHIQQTTVDGIETHQHDSDWTMDIGTRPRSDSWAIEPRPPTFGEEVNANISHSKPEPPPAVAFVGSWEAEMADRIAREVDECGRTPFMVSLSG
jgi:pantothenate kinase